MSLPTHAASPNCSVNANKPYRTPKNNVVYLVTPECTKRPFFNPAVYLSHFSDWNQVIFVEQDILDAIPEDVLRFVPWGPLRLFKNGSLVKLTSNPNVYLLEDNKAYPLADENAFKAFGYSFDQVEDVTSATLDKFAIQTTPLKDASSAPASLVFKYTDGPNVYILKQTDGRLAKVRLTSMDEVNAISRGDRIATLSTNAAFADLIQGTSGSDSSAPTILSFRFASPSSTSMTATISELTATDNIGVTAYLVTETTSTPSLTNPKWSQSPPTAYTFSSMGKNTLHAWVKDAIGNISANKSASVTIVDYLTDIKPPTITTVASTPTASKISITWKTNEDSDSVVTYGITDTYGHSTSSKTLATSHSIEVTDLIPGTLYHFRISSTDASSNTTITEDYTLTTKSDTTSPAVTAFSIPASSTSMIVPIKKFTATDDVGITGYMITRSTTVPFASSTDWLAAPPSNYDFARAGTVSLYPWVKDAAGNVSMGPIASTIITVGLTYPSIDSISATAFATGATITWTTSQPSKSVVSYGLTKGYGSNINDNTYISAHSAILTSLTPGTLYHYYITATNSGGAEQNSGDLTIQIP